MTKRVLRVLQMSERGLKVPALLEEVRGLFGACGEDELRAALQNLKASGMAVPVEDELTRDHIWELTAKGRGHRA